MPGMLRVCGAVARFGCDARRGAGQREVLLSDCELLVLALESPKTYQRVYSTSSTQLLLHSSQ